MAKKPTITTVATGYKATDTVNDNFTNVRNAFDNTLSLDGSTPNAMGADLDMNSYDIINVGNIYADTIIYTGALPIGNGGTGAVTAAGARTNLGLGTMATESSSNYLTTATASSTYLTQSSAASTYLTQTTADGIYQPLDGDLTSIAGLSGTSGILKKTGASTYTLDTTTYLTSAAIGVTVQGYDADLTTLGGLAKTDGNFIVGDGTTWVVESGSTARASLGLGTMATETASNYLTTSTAASTYQPLDSDLTTIASLAKTDGNFIVGDGTNWVTESGATARTSLGLGTMATETASNYLTTSSAASTYLTQTNAASTYQPLDSDLTAISSLSNADNNFIVGNGTTWVAESGATARTSLGLGTAATSNSTDFAAASHTHTASNITDFSEAVDDRVNGLLVAGSNVTLTYDDLANTLTIASTGGGSGSISDGDKGDITVSSSGTVWTIDNTAVTYAKIQNVSATDKLLGRSTAGAGSIEEITCTAAGRAILDDADATAQRTTLGAAASGSVTTSGLTQTSSRILGRTTATTGAIEELTVGTGLTLSAGSLSVTANTYQPLDADLTALAGLTPTADNFIVGNGTTWTTETTSQVRTTLGLDTADTPQFTGLEIGNVSDTTVTRSAAGVLAVEGGIIPKENRTNTFSSNQNISVTDNTNAGLRVTQLGTASAILADYYVGNNQSTNIRFNKARGSVATPGVVSSGDTLGQLRFYGYDGSAFQEAARIQADVSTGAGAGDMPGRLMFFTTADATTTPLERLRINNAGDILNVSTGVLGYGTGSGGSVTQGTSPTTVKTNGVTLDKTNGRIITNTGTINAGATATFTVTNNTVAATDVIIINRASGGTAGVYNIRVDAVASGSFNVSIQNTGATNLSEAITINFAVIKAGTS